MGPAAAVSPETPPHAPSTPPGTIPVPLRQHPGDRTGHGEMGTRTRHCPSSPGPWAPPWPPPHHPACVPGVSHGSHPGGLPRPPPAARGQAACPSARPAPTGRAAEPAERAGAEAAVGAKQRPGGRRFASLRLLKPGKKGKNCSLGLGAAWALGVVCDPAPWGPNGERRLSPHPALLPGTRARPRLAAQPLVLSTNTERGRSAAPGCSRCLQRGQSGGRSPPCTSAPGAVPAAPATARRGGLILPPLLTPSLAARSTQAGADLGGRGGPLAPGRAERRSGPPQYCSRSPNWERSGGVRGGRFHPEECERAWTPSKILVFCTGVS